MRFMVSRAGTRRCYISLLCVGDVGGKKQRKISSESECAFEKNQPFVSNATFTTNLRERRALSRVTVHTTQKLFFYIKGKKAPSPLPKRKRTYDAKANAQHHQTKTTPPNTVTQTVHHERAFKSILRERERQRERDLRRTRSRRKILPFFHEKT